MTEFDILKIYIALFVADRTIMLSRTSASVYAQLWNSLVVEIRTPSSPHSRDAAATAATWVMSDGCVHRNQQRTVTSFTETMTADIIGKEIVFTGEELVSILSSDMYKDFIAFGAL